ncbi:5141_t:CDS:10 [Entrophospora sp. SA101]|nr:5141_t:CDS:10 [Entrophospora sp. SA101]
MDALYFDVDDGLYRRYCKREALECLIVTHHLKFHTGPSVELRTPLLWHMNFEPDRRAINITINSSGTELSKNDRVKLFPNFEKLHPVEQLETPPQMPESTSMTPKQTGLPISPFVAADSHASTPPWVLDSFSMSLNNDNDNHDEVDENIMMAISYRYHKLGCAYYNDAASKLYLMEDMDESPPYDLVNLSIIVSSRADEVLVDLLKSKDDSIPIEPIVEIRPSSEFIYSSARTKLYNSCLNTKTFENNIYGESYKHETYLKLSSIIDMESVESVCCAGALITYISKSKITDVATTNISIKIFEDEAHPNMHMRSHTKEGLSLFGIMNCTRTTLGKRLLKQWFLRPTLDISIIHERQHTIECFIKPDNLKASSLLTKCLKHIKNIERIVQNIKGKLSVKDWQSLLQRTCAYA